MASKKIILIIFAVFCSRVESATLLERSYDYVMSLGKSLGPGFMSLLDCFGEEDSWACAKEKAGKMLDSWDQEVDKQRTSWQECVVKRMSQCDTSCVNVAHSPDSMKFLGSGYPEPGDFKALPLHPIIDFLVKVEDAMDKVQGREAADAEASSSGRAFEEPPSKLGREVEASLNSLTEIVQHGIARALSRKHHEGGGIDSITISAGNQEKKKKMKKKKQKPPKIHLVHPVHHMMMAAPAEEPKGGRSVENSGLENGTSFREGRNVMTEIWDMGEKALDAVAEHAMQKDQEEDGIADKSSVEEQRGKKKKKKKAILKLLILGAVLKAKIGTLLQILSFKLQVKFFILALIGLGINLARFWLDVKKQHQPPQKVIYYEHAQHQHHYDHEEEPGWGPWSRSMDPMDDSELDDIDVNTPYRAQEKTAFARPLLTSG